MCDVILALMGMTLKMAHSGRSGVSRVLQKGHVSERCAGLVLCVFVIWDRKPRKGNPRPRNVALSPKAKSPCQNPRPGYPPLNPQVVLCRRSSTIAISVICTINSSIHAFTPPITPAASASRSSCARNTCRCIPFTGTSLRKVARAWSLRDCHVRVGWRNVLLLPFPVKIRNSRMLGMFLAYCHCNSHSIHGVGFLPRLFFDKGGKIKKRGATHKRLFWGGIFRHCV